MVNSSWTRGKITVINWGSHPPSGEPAVESIGGPPIQLVARPVPGVHRRAPSPSCHSQSDWTGRGPKSQNTSSTVAVGGGAVTDGYLKKGQIICKSIFYLI